MVSDIYVGQSSVCDFCNDRDVVKVYYCPDFLVGEYNGIRHNSVGDWMACQECAKLVDAGDQEGLIERQLQGYQTDKEVSLTPEQITGVRNLLAPLTSGFLSRYLASDDIDEV